MNCKADIEKLAEQKLLAANCLLKNNFHDDAYYLAGYAIELYLKARVCKTLRIDDFFSFNRAPKELYRPFKNHDYLELLLLSGIYSDFKAALKDVNFKTKWSILSKWDESARYDVKEFVTLAEEFCKWIQKHL